MVIRDFTNFEDRQDKGVLWENFLFAEKIKQIEYHGELTHLFYWRTVAQQEIDCLTLNKKTLKAYEFKLNARKKIRFPKTFLKWYEAETKTINQDNFREFLDID